MHNHSMNQSKDGLRQIFNGGPSATGELGVAVLTAFKVACAQVRIQFRLTRRD